MNLARGIAAGCLLVVLLASAASAQAPWDTWPGVFDTAHFARWNFELTQGAGWAPPGGLPARAAMPWGLRGAADEGRAVQRRAVAALCGRGTAAAQRRRPAWAAALSNAADRRRVSPNARPVPCRAANWATIRDDATFTVEVPAL